MKKIFLLGILAFTLSKLKGQESLINLSKNSFNIGVGYSTSILSLNNNHFRLGGNSLSFPNLFSVRYVISEKNLVFIDYNKFSMLSFNQSHKRGDIVGFNSHKFDIGIGRILSCKYGVSLIPNLSFSLRPSGTQNVYVDYIQSSAWKEPIISTYQLKSLGFGLGFNCSKRLSKYLIISLDTRYNHFFEKNKLLGRQYIGYESFYYSYRVNRNMLTVGLGIFMNINMTRN